MSNLSATLNDIESTLAALQRYLGEPPVKADSDPGKLLAEYARKHAIQPNKAFDHEGDLFIAQLQKFVKQVKPANVEKLAEEKERQAKQAKQEADAVFNLLPKDLQKSGPEWVNEIEEYFREEVLKLDAAKDKKEKAAIEEQLGPLVDANHHKDAWVASVAREQRYRKEAKMYRDNAGVLTNHLEQVQSLTRDIAEIQRATGDVQLRKFVEYKIKIEKIRAQVRALLELVK